MRNPVASSILASCALGLAVLANTQASAETRVIRPTDDFTWLSNGKQSNTDGTPVIVDNLQVGDIIEIQIETKEPHGFITIKQLANLPKEQNQTAEPVLACGENTAEKPKAVLREIECGAQSNFGHDFRGSMKLEVFSAFANDVNFWCTEHFFMMTGTLKLKPKD